MMTSIIVQIGMLNLKKEVDNLGHNDFYLSGNTILNIQKNLKLPSESLNVGSTVEEFNEKTFK